MQNLMSIRWRSMGWSIFVAILVSVIGYFTSDTFQSLLLEHGVGTGITAVIMMLTKELAHYMSNEYNIGKARVLGAARGAIGEGDVTLI